MCKSGLSENKVQNSMHRMLLMFLIQRNTCMCMKIFRKDEQEGEGWGAAQHQRINGRGAKKFSEPWGVRRSGEEEVSRYPGVFPLSLDK